MALCHLKDINMIAGGRKQHLQAFISKSCSFTRIKYRYKVRIKSLIKINSMLTAV
jgi:hypothetical protein